MSKWRIVRASLVVVLALLVSSPWLSTSHAEQRVVHEFEAAWRQVTDGCGFNCEGCGVTGSRRLVLGYLVEIQYACGLLPRDSPDSHVSARAYVSPFGTVHLVPRP